VVGAGFGDDIARFFYAVIIIGVLVGGGSCFGAGYYIGKHGGCGYSVKIQKNVDNGRNQ
jgi:hypothetical protein